MRISNLLFSSLLRPGSVRTLVTGGLTRTYVVHTPKGDHSKMPLPVVLALHGATMNGPMMAWLSGLNRKSDEAGFIAVYPNGTGTRSSFFWNGGNFGGPAAHNTTDDVAFIDAMLDDLMGSYRIDAKRVYATGMSNGAIMAYRLAAELSERIAAVAPVAGAVATEVGPKRPVPILHFHGTSDQYVPFTGGRGERSIIDANYRSAEDSIRLWVRANGCNEIPQTDLLSKGDDGMTVTRRTYRGPDAVEVALIVIEGGGHTWPGRRSPAKALGPSTLAVSANDLMWEFFRRHSMN